MDVLRQQTAEPILVSLGHISNLEDYKHEKPYEVYVEMDSKHPKTNLKFAMCNDIELRNARLSGTESFTLEKNGFRFLEHDFQDDLTAQSIGGKEGDFKVIQYLERLESIIRLSLGAERAILYDWRLRSSRSELSFPRPAHRTLQLPPASWVHADESAACGRKMVMEHLTEQERIMVKQGTWHARIINVWRPLVDIVKTKPLALCDWNSVNPIDWELCDQIMSDRLDEAMYLIHQKHHKWYWLPEQRKSELSMFVVWDSSRSKPDSQTSTPHAAFDLPEGGEQFIRESIEVRTIVLTRL